MPEFVNPFSGVTPGRKLTKREFARAVRLALSAEEEATHLYTALADATDDPLAKAVMEDIANEERVHKGEFHRLLHYLLPDEDQYMAEGAAEVDEMARAAQAGAAPAAAAEKPVPSVGNLKA